MTPRATRPALATPRAGSLREARRALVDALIAWMERMPGISRAQRNQTWRRPLSRAGVHRPIRPHEQRDDRDPERREERAGQHVCRVMLPAVHPGHSD